MEKQANSFCESALKKGFIDIIKLSYVLGCDNRYTVPEIVNLWKTLSMHVRFEDTPDLSTPEKKIGAWFRMLQVMISGKAAGAPLSAMSISEAPIDYLPAKHDIIQLKDLMKFFEVQLELPSCFDFKKIANKDCETVYHMVKQEQMGGDTQAKKSTGRNQSIVTIYTPPETTWEQIKIRYVNDDHIEISHPGVKTHAPYSMADLGMDSKPTLSSLLKLFAEYHGELNNENMTTKALKANISNLRMHLKKIFPNIEESPIAKYHKKKGYVCKFIIR
ncbi:hypothetical protein DO021_03010 [Desulfobacter hydrogenophilus]|uniref:Uncharacterized protein n=1 Tax=Desulfobacter hydrogenophilus TaxID=2291 RepID=A0A328FKN0_9BACT|nr:hypothetical protein [Desulfobacter hydrogenophilus]NDY71443.1 hypothetical protein [Desulfobacter hydrogenophilus]QBH12182.1 hypothetical protein EYB58_04110 [Desulfobacter hydrogenophilus]RAM03495.1 hypothetical protein DO021_03010 [Desulfobacter hydrogenophilus]